MFTSTMPLGRHIELMRELGLHIFLYESFFSNEIIFRVSRAREASDFINMQRIGRPKSLLNVFNTV